MLLDEDTLFNELAGDGGESLRRFMNGLIAATALSYGISDSQLRFGSKSNVPDGGVDAETEVAFSGDNTGWFGHPTVWQFKAEDAHPQRAEFDRTCSRPRMNSLVRAGYALRWVVRSHISQSVIASCEGQLAAVIHAINPNAPKPRILGINELFRWLQRYPQLAFDSVPAAAGVLSLATWRVQCEAVLPHFVALESHAPHRARILEHVDFGRTPQSPVLRIHGPCGVGKTRLVNDALSTIMGATHLVAYAPDSGRAEAICRHVATHPGLSAIVVADESSPATVSRLADLLEAEARRVRVIALDNAEGGRGRDGIFLRPLTTNEVNEVLAKNFGKLAPTRRWYAANLSEGYLRFAAELCHRDDFELTKDSIRSYLERRLEGIPHGLDSVALFGLFSKLGWKGDRRSQLLISCAATNLDATGIRRCVLIMKDAPGFIAIRGRFAYVTPPIVANAAFAIAWDRFGLSRDFEGFWNGLDDELREAFVTRAKHGSEEARDLVSRAIRPLAEPITVQALLDAGRARRICQLVEMAPAILLPRVRQVIIAATDHELEALVVVPGDTFTGSCAARFNPRPREGATRRISRGTASPKRFQSAPP